MTNNDEDKYKGAENCLLNNNELCIYRFLCPKEVIMKKRILIGKLDSGYVLLDDLKDIKIAYSFGINGRIDFDKDLADRNIDVYMYDQKIKSPPYKNNRFHWKKIGLGGKSDKNNLLKPLDELIKENGHSSEKNMILKINSELFDWDALKDLPENNLKQFKYITLELYFKNNAKLYYDVLKKLNKTHQVFYLSCHNGAKIITFGDNRVCEILDVSYIIRENNTFIKDSSIYPIPEFNKGKEKSEMNLNIFKLFDP